MAASSKANIADSWVSMKSPPFEQTSFYKDAEDPEDQNCNSDLNDRVRSAVANRDIRVSVGETTEHFRVRFLLLPSRFDARMKSRWSRRGSLYNKRRIRVAPDRLTRCFLPAQRDIGWAFDDSRLCVPCN